MTVIKLLAVLGCMTYDLFRICYIQEKINKHFILLKKKNPFLNIYCTFCIQLKPLWSAAILRRHGNRKWGRKDRREIKPRPRRNDTEEQCNAIKTNYCQLVREYWDFSDNWASFGMQLFTFCTFFFFTMTGMRESLGSLSHLWLGFKYDALWSFSFSQFCVPPPRLSTTEVRCVNMMSRGLTDLIRILHYQHYMNQRGKIKTKLTPWTNGTVMNNDEQAGNWTETRHHVL